MKFISGAALALVALPLMQGCSDTQAAPNPADMRDYVVIGEKQLGANSCSLMVRPLSEPEAVPEKREYYWYNRNRPASHGYVSCKRSRPGGTVQLISAPA